MLHLANEEKLKFL